MNLFFTRRNRSYFITGWCRGNHNFYCPGKAAAMGSIVVSLTCTAYQWATLIAFYGKVQQAKKSAKEESGAK